MRAEPIAIRVDATNPPNIGPGDRVCQGQSVCPESGEQTYPTSGTVVSVDFDPENHEFVIVVAPLPNRNRGE